MDRAEDRLALIEVLGRDGSVLRAIDVHAWPLSIGRALANDIVLDDPYVAASHAALELDESGQLVLRAQATRNGVVHDDQRLDPARGWPVPATGAQLALGATRLRLRLPGEVLAPEKPLPGAAGSDRWRLIAAGVALFALQWFGYWLSLDPGVDYSAWLPILFGLPLVLVAWCGLWALLSKLFSHHFDFGGHLRVALPWMLLLAAVPVMLPQLAASLDMPLLWHLTVPLQGLALALLLRAHLVQALPLQPRTISVGVAAFTLLGLGITIALALRNGDTLSGSPYASTLPLPTLRLAGTVPSAELVQAMAPIAAQLAQRAKKARADEDADGVDDNSE